MAWVNIPDTATDPDAPLTSSLAKAWTGNPIAIANGDPGAPRISSEGADLIFARDITSNTTFNNTNLTCFLISGYVTADAFASAEVSTSYSSNNGSTWSTGRNAGGAGDSSSTSSLRVAFSDVVIIPENSNAFRISFSGQGSFIASIAAFGRVG